MLGTGCSGKVIQATSRATGCRAAVKTLSLVGISEKAKKELDNEVAPGMSIDFSWISIDFSWIFMVFS